MRVVELRNKLVQLINSVDEDYLRELFAYTEQKEADKNSGIVGYTVQGEPLTKEMYKERVQKTEAAVKAGNFTTIEDLEKEAENW